MEIDIIQLKLQRIRERLDALRAIDPAEDPTVRARIDEQLDELEMWEQQEKMFPPE
ncbi:hypothetical protein [Corynebacterium cystitidis]|uniref:hypothetical protein n=1 Tax=Corynebacterium cystitidis TaxID=35757 RepID=UPI00211F37A4|nr:hypothetical protein [Corynebacterium cystitidis]